MDLHPDRMAADPVEGRCVDGGEHGSSPTSVLGGAVVRRLRAAAAETTAMV
jgi:hypothetical protein